MGDSNTTERIKLCYKGEFFNFGDKIYTTIPGLKETIREAFTSECAVEVINRKEKDGKRRGIKARSLNEVLRELLKKSAEKYKVMINAESFIKDGWFRHDGNRGFDFSLFDKERNYANAYNYFLGAKGILRGDELIFKKEVYKELGIKREEWIKRVDKYKAESGFDNKRPQTDYAVEKSLDPIVGELQFGNWALIYRDLFRLMAAEHETSIALYIYITSDDKLYERLSSQTVRFDKASKVISENLGIIKTPIWLIGLSIDE